MIVLIHTYGSEKIDEAVKHGSVQVDEYTTRIYSHRASMVKVETTPILLVRNNDGLWNIQKGETKVTEHLTWWMCLMGIIILLLGFIIPYVYAKTKPIGKSAHLSMDIFCFVGLVSLGMIHTIPAVSIAGGIVAVLAIITALLLKPGSAEMVLLVICAILGSIFAYFLSVHLSGLTYPLYAGVIGLCITVLAVWATGEASKH